MLIMIHENDLELLEKAQKHVAVIHIGDQSKKPDKNVNLNYPTFPGLLPDKDTLNAIDSGHISLKDVIKDSVKSLNEPNSAENVAFNTVMTNILVMAKRGKKECVVALAYDDSAHSKTLRKYVARVFRDVYGIEILDKNKVLKGIFKKGNAKKIQERVKEYSGKKKNHATPDEHGKLVIVKNTEFFRCEMLMSLLCQGGAVGSDVFATGMVDMFTCDNLKTLDSHGIADIEMPQKLSKSEKKSMGKKERAKYDKEVKAAEKYLKSVKKLYKGLKAKNFEAYAAYKTFIDIWETLDPVELKAVGLHKTPKVKKGTTTKGKKNNKVVVSKMSKSQIKDFKEFYNTKNGPFLGRLAFAHISNELMGITVGENEYSAVIKAVMNNVQRLKGKKAMTEVQVKELTNAYLKAAKAYAKGSTPTK